MGLVVGAHLLVGAASYFARALGMSDVLVGLTIVAFGTSLPELATSIVAALRREMDIAIGNVVGSNVFNSLAILGTAATVRPLRADPALLTFEIPVMIGISLLFLPLAYTQAKLERWEGAVLVGSYVAFTTVLVARATGYV